MGDCIRASEWVNVLRTIKARRLSHPHRLIVSSDHTPASQSSLRDRLFGSSHEALEQLRRSAADSWVTGTLQR